MTTGALRGEKVLILGGLGFIGSNLAAACLQQGAAVTIYDSLHPRAGGNVANIADIMGDVAVIRDDIRHADGVSAALRGAQVIFNCVALTSHPDSMQHPHENIDVNCGGLVTVLEAMRQTSPEAKFVQVGTSTQIGKMQQTPIDETHPEFPLDMYSANKSAGEKYTLLYGRAYGLRTTVVRLANTFGPRACIRTPEFGFVNYFIGLALQGNGITVYGNGAQRRNISYVDDSVAALLLAARRDDADGEVFFATADSQTTVRDVAESIADVVGGAVRFVPWPADRAAIEIGDAVISNRKIRAQLAWAPTYTLREGLEHAREYFLPRLRDYL